MFKFSSQTKKILNFLFLIVFSLAVIILRKPDAFANPQFWAEDGNMFYAGAYNTSGLKPIFSTVNGYLSITDRVVAAIAQFFPLVSGPLVFNFFALFFQLLPVLLLFSSRFDRLLPSLKSKILIVLLYLFVFNTSEIYLNVTNSKWYLGLTALMIILTQIPKAKNLKFFEAIVLIFAGLTGPFAIFLSPVAFFNWLKRKERLTFLKLLVIGSTAVVQIIIEVLNHGGGGRVFPSVITFSLFWKIILKQVIWGAVGGWMGYGIILNRFPWPQVFLNLTGILAVLTLLYVLIKGPWELKLFFFFTGFFFLVSLLIPSASVSEGKSSWEVLLEAQGIRYWFYPMLAFLLSLAYGLRKKNPFLIKAISVFFLSFFVLFTFLNCYRRACRYPSYIDYHYRQEVEKFLSLPKGEKMAIPINPPGWEMELVRK